MSIVFADGHTTTQETSHHLAPPGVDIRFVLCKPPANSPLAPKLSAEQQVRRQ